jgi:hypothetical protein
MDQLQEFMQEEEVEVLIQEIQVEQEVLGVVVQVHKVQVLQEQLTLGVVVEEHQMVLQVEPEVRE